MARPFYIVFAGVNGAGKTTFYQSGLWRTEDMPRRMQRIDPDEIARDMHAAQGNAGGIQLDMRAGRAALEIIDRQFSQSRSFNQETTLSGRLAVRNIVQAHEQGYRVFMYYIGLDDVSTALARIEHRVSLGGHYIDERTVRKRLDSSVANLARCLDYCEQVMVFDNTVDFKCLALWAHGVLTWWGGSVLAGDSWLFRAMTNDELWRREKRA